MDNEFSGRPLFAALRVWAASKQHGYRLSGSPDALSQLQLHARPDLTGPEFQITFRPEIVDGHAVIRADFPKSEQSKPETRPTSAAALQVVIPAPTGRDPTARCDGCGVVGTIGSARRTDPSGAVVESHRFCVACWPEQSARYRARWKEEDRLRRDRFFRGREPARGAGPGTVFEAATWHVALEMVRDIERRMIAPIVPSKESLAELAKRLEALASQVEGEMPFAVESFIRRYGASGALATE